jgi:hypothetical protein
MPLGLQCKHLFDDRFHVRYQRAFGKFNLQTLRRGTCALEYRQHLVDEFGLAKLMGADIHRNREMGHLGAGRPACKLRAGGRDYPATQRQYQRRLFGQGNELPGRDHAAGRVLPADQRLGPGQASAGQLGLVVEQELPHLDGVAQIVFQCGTPHDRDLHGRVEEAQGVASGILRLVHGQIGLFQQVFDAGEMAPGKRGTNAGGAVVFDVPQSIDLVEGHQDLVTNGFGLGRRLRLVCAQAGKHDDELVAAQSRHGITRANAG